MYSLEFKATMRKYNLEHQIRWIKTHGDILPANRIVNRTLYGTDYDPKEVGFRYVPEGY